MTELDWTERAWSAPLADPAYRDVLWNRLLASISVMDSGCWVWLKYRNPDGYGVISVKSRMTSAHQVSLAISRGCPWPHDLQVDHLCCNRACCNPAHLELVTPAENTKRGYGPSVAAGRGKTRTHCKQGHEFTERNTYRHPRTGRRACRRCRADIQTRTLRAAGINPRDLQGHGTRARFRRHRKAGETPCAPCANAAREYARSRRAARGGGDS